MGIVPASDPRLEGEVDNLSPGERIGFEGDYCPECAPKVEKELREGIGGPVFWQCVGCKSSGQLPGGADLARKARRKAWVADGIPREMAVVLTFGAGECPHCLARVRGKETS